MHSIIQYRDRCIGCGVCFELQPEYWRMSRKDGKAVLLRGEKKKSVYIRAIPESALREAKRVANACPLRVIKVQ